MWARSLASACVLALVGCHDRALTSPACSFDGDATCPLDCGPGIDSPAFEGATHVAIGTHVSYAANPPASGDHYPTPWMPWGLQSSTIAPEYWVHNLEHGGIVELYNCPQGCDADVQALVALMNGRPPDQFGEHRFIITAEASLPRRFAVVAWLWRWQGDAIDFDTIDCFIKRRYDRAPESLP